MPGVMSTIINNIVYIINKNHPGLLSILMMGEKRYFIL
jgi:hypothetical protein